VEKAHEAGMCASSPRHEGRKWRLLLAACLSIMALQCLDLYLSAARPSRGGSDPQLMQRLRLRSSQ
jgi:hypothetical protein